jgi:hypothetical protein
MSGMPSVESLLRQRRLGYLYSITSTPAHCITALAQGWNHWPCTDKPSSWAAMLLLDLFELQSQSSVTRALGPPDTCFYEWVSFIKSGKWRWKTIVRGYHKSTVAYRSYAPTSIDTPEYGGSTNGHGTIYIHTKTEEPDNSDIWIYA